MTVGHIDFVRMADRVRELTDRWDPLRPHPEQYRLFHSTKRFRVVPAGRRSGKTELAKRFVIIQACLCPYRRGRFIFCAPTRPQAKKIYWDDLLDMVPRELMRRPPMISELTIFLANGATIEVHGMDKPARIEGPPLDGIVLDEYANMKATAFDQHVRPALSTVGRPGWAWFIGVPRGRNHYYDTFMNARKRSMTDWDAFTWTSASVLTPEEIIASQQGVDPLIWRQEYEADFLTFAGRVYYPFDRDIHAATPLDYDPHGELIFCFDFNVDPGSAVVCQEQKKTTYDPRDVPETLTDEFTAVIGEVHIPRNSNTEAVVNRLIADWGEHKGKIKCYGDPTGGNRGTAKLDGSDWEIIRKMLHAKFGTRAGLYVNRRAKPERPRVNALNARLRWADGSVHCLVDPDRCEETIKDFEGVTLLKGGSGEIDKRADDDRTHWSDAFGYYCERRHPIVTGAIEEEDW